MITDERYEPYAFKRRMVGAPAPGHQPEEFDKISPPTMDRYAANLPPSGQPVPAGANSFATKVSKTKANIVTDADFVP
jgi:hypothetical protein